MRQEAPDPTELRDLVEKVAYKPEWYFTLHDDFERDLVDGEVVGRGMTLDVLTCTRKQLPP